MLADVLADYIDGDMIIHAGDDDIGVARRGTHKSVEGRPVSYTHLTLPTILRV